MKKRFFVTRLEEIAFTACYREILSNLLLCPEHRPEDRLGMNSYSSLISLNPIFTSSNVRGFVRSRLNHHLIGIMNDDIRKKFISEFNRNFYDADQKSDIWVFLDCVLDNSFTELETHVVFPKTEPNEKFVHSICNRSPSVEVLKMNFEMVSKSTPMAKLNPIISSLSSLVNLTSLSLNLLHKHHRELLNYIGNSCPRLQHFCITGFRILKKDILALMLGGKLKQFPEKEMFEEEKNVILEILTEYLSPFCFTLQHLQLEDLEEKKKFRKGCEFSGLYPASVALLVRHMPNLRRIDHSSSSLSSAIKLLHQIPSANETIGSNHKNIYGESQDYTDPRLPSPFIRNSPFSGIISLTSIDFVNISDEILMKAVGRMCPHLKEVTFSELLHTDALSPDKLFTILTTEWPKVERATLIKVSTNNRKAILLGIGAQLSQLTFVSCELIDVADLISCAELEVLRIFFSSTLLLPSENPEEKYYPPKAFLPKLNRLESDICLRSRYSHLFEEKSTLTYLDLECCHVGTKASNISNWNEITKYWQRIHTLHIRQCTGLTMTGTKTLTLQLTKLKELSLPSGMLNYKDEREISYDLMNRFNKGPLKICLKFERSQSSLICPYQDQNGPYETSDEELSSEDSDESSHGFGISRNDLDAREDYGGWMDEIDVFNEDVEDFFEEYDDDEDVENFFEENDDGEDEFLNW